jgi:hypothetical protein
MSGPGYEVDGLCIQNGGSGLGSKVKLNIYIFLIIKKFTNHFKSVININENVYVYSIIFSLLALPNNAPG